MIALILAAALAVSAPIKGAPVTYQATVIHPVDGDSFVVHVDGFPPIFDPIEVRVFGIDTPEHVMPPAQKRCEVALGLAASEAAKAFIIPGEVVTLHMVVGRRDKYGRLLSTVTLPDGRDYGALMVASGHARAYGADGDLHKAPWC